MNSFRQAVLASGNNPGGRIGMGRNLLSGLPAPFDAVTGNRLTGPKGSHPLATIGTEELVRRSSDGLDGQIAIADPVRIGEAIAGRLTVTARRDISARGAIIRIVGGLITERQRSREERNSKGNVVGRDEWVEVDGKLFDDLPFSQPALPTSLSAGQTFETDFSLPAPRLGPPSAHMGSALIAWAIDAKWDMAMRGDERVTALVDVRQNIDYLRSGAVRLEQGALFDAWQVGDASMAVAPLPPAVAGSEVDVTVNWPSADSGRGARLELQADVKAPNRLSRVVLYSATLDPAAFRGGVTMKVPIPADAPPSLDDKGVAVGYFIRALVDRPLRSDLAVERALAVM